MAACKEYYKFLTSGIDDLERVFTSTDSMSIQFLQKTLSFLRSINTQFTLLVHKIPLNSGDKWLYEYMKESDKYWKLCKILKSIISRMDSFYSNAFNFISSFEDDQDHIHQHIRLHREQVLYSIGSCKLMARRMEEANGFDAFPLPLNFDNINVMNEFKLIEFNGFKGVLYAISNVSSLLFAILVYGLMNYSPEYGYLKGDDDLSGRLLFGSGCLISMERLKKKVAMEIERTQEGNEGLLMYEFKRTMSAVEVLEIRLRETRGRVAWRKNLKIRKKIDDLKDCLEMLKSGTQIIRVEIHDFIDEIMEERKKMFDFSISKQ
ncbi:uncharacterized protein LOC124924959 [Impatiens glandulifera]|uniref:uncharacterized protein LOC124924959 n=1 Tax=Impatiens glandulifera TaxID=253017 RepID=UPI001FB05F1A|nr:uncharacterized protein LOC124924959 [Impatiens glandulifera]